MFSHRPIKQPTAAGQQQTANDKGLAGTEAIRRQTGGNAAGNQHDGGNAVRLQRQRRGNAKLLLQVSRGHQDHHHDTGGQQPGQQHRHHHFLAMVKHHGFQRQLLRQGFARLHLDENWRFLQPAAQVHRHQAENAAQQERNAPAPLGDGLLAERSVDHRRHQRAQQDTDRQTGGQGTAGKTNAAARHVFGNKHPGPRHFTTNRCTLQHAHQQQQERRGNTYAGVGR
ncbi:hypothetical protein D3C71_1428020 [compost metagenome]